MIKPNGTLQTLISAHVSNFLVPIKGSIDLSIMYSCYDSVFVLNGLHIHVQTALIRISLVDEAVTSCAAGC
jgi:hypothetical protein